MEMLKDFQQRLFGKENAVEKPSITNNSLKHAQVENLENLENLNPWHFTLDPWKNLHWKERTYFSYFFKF